MSGSLTEPDTTFLIAIGSRTPALTRGSGLVRESESLADLLLSVDENLSRRVSRGSRVQRVEASTLAATCCGNWRTNAKSRDTGSRLFAFTRGSKDFEPGARSGAVQTLFEMETETLEMSLWQLTPTMLRKKCLGL